METIAGAAEQVLVGVGLWNNIWAGTSGGSIVDYVDVKGKLRGAWDHLISENSQRLRIPAILALEEGEERVEPDLPLNV